MKHKNHPFGWMDDPDSGKGSEHFPQGKIPQLSTPDAGPSSPNALAVLKGYEQWEADLIGNNACWGPEGMATSPKIIPELWDKLIELQAQRNAVLYPEKYPTTEGQSSPGDAVKFAEFIADNYWERNEDYMWFKNPPLKIWVENRDEAQHTTEQLYQQFLTSQK